MLATECEEKKAADQRVLRGMGLDSDGGSSGGSSEEEGLVWGLVAAARREEEACGVWGLIGVLASEASSLAGGVTPPLVVWPWSGCVADLWVRE